MAIREFHQIIEDHKSDECFKHLVKYGPLRSVLSHGEPIHVSTLETHLESMRSTQMIKNA